MSKERAALGVFGGDSDDEDERPSFGGGRGGGPRDRERSTVEYVMLIDSFLNVFISEARIALIAAPKNFVFCFSLLHDDFPASN
jgi:hypothetical protein